ncbi:hypothetical protein AAVH_27353 [Aphelenchoides avenae]|nr:hypothetical protein AAVH_27353 [Aphelenchus avenae]
MQLNNTVTTMADGLIAQSDGQSGLRNISTFNIVVVAVIVVVLIAMLASMIYQGLAQLKGGSYDMEKSLKPDRPSISSLAFKVRQSIGWKQADPEAGGTGTTKATISRRQRQGTVGQEWYKLFKQCDKDNTGRIPLATFAGFVKGKALELSLKPAEAAKVASEADLNGDGYVDFTEFAETQENKF